MNAKVVEVYARKLAAEYGRPVGRPEAEDRMYEVVRRVSRALGPKLVYGYHTPQDIEQDAIVLAMEVLEGEAYDASRPLENFLYVHLRRRLMNNIRKHYYRGEPPCTCCDTTYPPAEPCKKWIDWSRRNASKQNLMRPLDVDNVADDAEPRMASPSSALEDAVSNEMLAAIDDELPLDLRADYLRMREHVTVPKSRRQRVRDAVLSIIAGKGRTKGDGGACDAEEEAE